MTGSEPINAIIWVSPRQKTASNAAREAEAVFGALDGSNVEQEQPDYTRRQT